MYSDQLLDHFQNPRNPGELSNPCASTQLENPVCGDVLLLTINSEANRITEIRFLAQGCVAAMACASALTELVLHKSLTEARSLKREDLMQAVGGLPPESTHASHLAIDTLKAALHQLPE